MDSARHLVTLVDIELHKIAEETLRASLAEVRRHDAWMVGLYRMNDLLLSCETRAEAEAVIAQGAGVIFAGHSGALALRQNGAPEFRLVASWGGGRGLPDTVQMRDCWALRRGETYEVADPADAVHCPHVHGNPGHPYLCVPLNVRGETLGLLHLEAGGRSPSASWGELRTLTETVGESVKLVLSNLRLQEALREQALRDPLTGLFNRRYLDETLHRELSRRERRTAPLAVAMLNLDRFKSFNETQGREAGDQALQEIGRLILQSLGGGDIACRYGDDAFILMLPDATVEEARTRLDGLRQAIAGRRPGDQRGRAAAHVGLRRHCRGAGGRNGRPGAPGPRRGRSASGPGRGPQSGGRRRGSPIGALMAGDAMRRQPAGRRVCLRPRQPPPPGAGQAGHPARPKPPRLLSRLRLGRKPPGAVPVRGLMQGERRTFPASL